ncbi:aspartate/glutamate racemase family protein [Vibrio sp. SCSIO 43136]|uniref:aspartate/glutamate racemase family protein n=1 Tax=Vibrio sp. SCSIO 43136 TaxID=2819101 RepID=UPI002075BFB6|nr:aspartate/glutamate racemase family protein [Vibrio sp. SCSIO 43136]USD64040.1 aspartate/glutamate racemase family protein [Vibrio sp. SCSIO 43136]
MKTIGLLGGMSWESTTSYYSALNQGIKQKLGALHSAKISLYSVDFEEIKQLQHQNKWDETADILGQAAQSVQAAGADFLLICTNTMHKVAPEIEAQIDIPILHIADATAYQLKQDGVTKVGLLGTRFTMEQDFYKQRLIDRFGIDVVVPTADDQTLVHDVIYQELCQGEIKDSSRQAYVGIISKLADEGAQAVILGCTEIALLVKQSHTKVPLYDTTQIHSEKAVEWALEDQ